MQQTNSVLFIVLLMTGLFFVVIGAGSFFTRNNPIGLLQLVAGLFIAGIGIYRFLHPIKKK